MEAFLAEKKGLKQVVLASVTGTPVVGARVPMKDLKRVAFVVQVAAAASAVLSATLQQHNAASAGTSKDLSVANNYYHKVDAATSFTKVVPVAAAATYNLFTIADVDVATFVFEVLQEDLDVNGNFNFVSLNVTGDATARVVGVLAVGDAEYCPAYALSL
jgi:hypothetical protein